VFYDNASGGGEAESGASGFGGHIGVKDFLEMIGIDSGAGVDDMDDCVVALIFGSHHQFAGAFRHVCSGHGLNGVDHEIEQGLFEEGFVDFCVEGF